VPDLSGIAYWYVATQIEHHEMVTLAVQALLESWEDSDQLRADLEGADYNLGVQEVLNAL